jgi:hypothetical protein
MLWRRWASLKLLQNAVFTQWWMKKSSYNHLITRNVGGLTYILTIVNSFLVNMTYAFQDREKLYLVMDFLNGGDLRFHIGRMRRFKEHQTSSISFY